MQVVQRSRKRTFPEFEIRLVELHTSTFELGIYRSTVRSRYGSVKFTNYFLAIMQRTSDPIDLFMKWYNYDRPHMSLKDGRERPAAAFIRKQPPKDVTVIERDQ